MFAICIESSHQKGMGHLFRSLNLIDFLEQKREKYIVCINNDNAAISILKKNDILFEIVNYDEFEYNWETEIIEKYQIRFWINDRLETDRKHALKVKENEVKLVTLDDSGSGSEYSDIHFAALANEETTTLKGKKILTGLDYLILNKEIDSCTRIRKVVEKILVTLGGSDTYGVTIKVVEILKKFNKEATIIIGPSFKHNKELKKIVDDGFIVKKSVPSLIKEFVNYDIAITGGGITPFEANASGLPCIIIASELFEIHNGKFLNNLGSSAFAGYYKEINLDLFQTKFDIETMSHNGIENIKLNGVENIYNEITKDFEENSSHTSA